MKMIDKNLDRHRHLGGRSSQGSVISGVVVRGSHTPSPSGVVRHCTEEGGDDLAALFDGCTSRSLPEGCPDR